MAALLSMLVAAGCSVHPKPDDVTGLSTTQIAEHIRCEARTAIERKAIEMLRRAAVQTGPNGEARIPEAADLADRLQNGTVRFADARKYLKGKRETDFYDTYINTAIAYDFTFDMTEDNLASTQLDFIKLITTPLPTNSNFGFGVSASNDRMRENIRKFLVTDTFKDLLTKNIRDCDSVPVGPNLVYPIVGEIGLYELISTFIDLNVEGINITPKDKAPALGDQLQFNTTFVGSITPKVVLTPMGHAFRLADASLTNTESRIDKHAVIIGLSLPPKKSDPPRPTTPLGVGILARSVFAQRILFPAQTRAVEAITQFRIDLYYDRSAAVAVR